MQKRNEFTPRPCSRCGQLVIDVRDAFTYATYPVNAVAVSGLALTPAKDPRKNPLAHRRDLYVPHLPECDVGPRLADLLPDEQTESVDDPRDFAEEQPDARDPEEPIEHPGDLLPGALPPGGMAGEEE